MFTVQFEDSEFLLGKVIGETSGGGGGVGLKNKEVKLGTS